MASADWIQRDIAKKYGIDYDRVWVDYRLDGVGDIVHEVRVDGKPFAIAQWAGGRNSMRILAKGEAQTKQYITNYRAKIDRQRAADKQRDRERKERERQAKMARIKSEVDQKSERAVTDFRKRQEEIRNRPADVKQYQAPSVEAGQTPVNIENTMQQLNPNDQRVVDEQRREGQLPVQTANQQPQQTVGAQQPQQQVGGQQQYVIQQGDNLSSLALRFGTTTQEILRLNPSITNPNLIRTGANLILPGQAPVDTQTQDGGLQGTGEQPSDIENTMQQLSPEDQAKVNDLRNQGIIPKQDTFDYTGTGAQDPVDEVNAQIDTSIQELETTLGDLSKNTFENLLNSPEVAQTITNPNLEDTITNTINSNFYRNAKIDVSKINSNQNPITFDTKEFDAAVYKQQVITQKVIDQSPPDAYKDKNVIDTTNRISDLYDEMYALKDAKNDILKFVKKKGQGNLSFALLESFSMVKTKEVNYQIDRISRQIDTANRVLKTQLDRYAVLSENFWKQRQFLLQVGEMNLKETELARRAFDQDRSYRLSLQKLKLDQLENDRNYQLRALQHNLMVDKARTDTLQRDRQYNLDVVKTKMSAQEMDRRFKLDVKKAAISQNTAKDQLALQRQQVGLQRDQVNLEKARVQLADAQNKSKTKTPVERYAKMRSGIKAGFSTTYFGNVMNILKTLSGDVKNKVTDALGYQNFWKTRNSEIDDITRDYSAILQKIHNDTATDEEVDKFYSLYQILSSKAVGVL